MLITIQTAPHYAPPYTTMHHTSTQQAQSGSGAWNAFALPTGKEEMNTTNITTEEGIGKLYPTEITTENMIGVILFGL